MAKPKPDDLIEVYECLFECFFNARSFEDIRLHIGSHVIFFGTARHEKYTGPDEMCAFCAKNNEEMKNLSVKTERTGILSNK
ncbi:MAG: hypothetical protein ACKODM_05775, partial [Cytophagales bacterium]